MPRLKNEVIEQNRVKRFKDRTIMEDLPSLRKKMKKIDDNRLARLKAAKEQRKFSLILSKYVEDKIRTPKTLDAQQRAAILLLCDFHNEPTYEYVAKKVGVTIQTLNSWRNNPVFIAAMDKEITKRQNFMRLHAFRNVNRAIARGSMRDTWKFLEMTGDLKKKIEVTDNTGERELSDEELEAQIADLKDQVEHAHDPSGN